MSVLFLLFTLASCDLFTQIVACVGFAYPVCTKIRKKPKKKTGPKKKKKVFEEGWQQVLLLEDDQMPSTSSVSEGARRLKLQGLFMSRFRKMKRLQMVQYGLLLIDKI